jgi:predicted MPP superfamily phosphohydrolase
VSYELGLLGRISVATHRFEMPRAHARPLTIAFASDFHAGGTTDPRLLHDAFRALHALDADVVLLGGDYVAFEARELAPLLPLIASLRPSLGIYGVLGNHDLTTDSTRIVSELERAGVTMLTNRGVRLPAPHDDVWLCGLDDPTLGRPHADAAFAAAAESRVVLMHSPDGLLSIGDREFDVAFCGHTHGGQVTLPGGLAPVVPKGRLSRRFLHGTYRVSDRARMLVSAGVGCSTLPIRLFASPEVHLCTLVRRAAENAEAA